MNPRKSSRGLDWAEARARLAKAARALGSQEGGLAPEQARAILERRARALARPLDAERPRENTFGAVVFTLASERYAIETRYIREVTRLADLAGIPGAPPRFAGLTNLRGEILLVIDLRELLGLPGQGVTDHSRLVVLGSGGDQVGLLATSVLEVSALSSTDILPAPDGASGVGREFLRGVTRDALIVLDGSTLLNHPRLFLDSGKVERTLGEGGQS